MPTRLLLDGPDIETVLTRVQEEHGSAARIVRAERVRSGGLAGFFAKERYEVSVEVDPDAAPAPPVLDVTPARTLGRRSVADEPSPPEPTYDEHTYDDATYDDDLPPALRVAQEMDGMLPAPVAPPVVSTGGSAFADVLGSITSSLGHAEEVTDPWESFAAAHQTAPEPVDDGCDSFVLSPAPAVVRPTGRHAIGAAPTPPVPADPVALAIEPAPAPDPALLPAPLPVPLPVPLAARAIRPPRAPGAVLVLVGDARVAGHAARDLARTMGINPGTVLLAAAHPQPDLVPEARRLPTPPEARVAAGRLMMADRPGVVVVDHPIGTDAGWTNAVLDALGATAVWAVVDATRKAADLARWTSALLRVDALVVHNVAATEDVSCVTTLGLPIALLDAQPTTGPAWHALEER